MIRRRYARELLAFFLALGMVASCASGEDEDNFFDVGGGIPDASMQQPEAAAGTGNTSTETCTDIYCPRIGQGEPCCISSQGPCGMNSGRGCQQLTGPDQ